MSSSLSKCLFLNLLFSIATLGFAQSLLDAAPANVTVWIHNYSAAPTKTVQEAAAEAARILRTAGLESLWIECPLPRPGALMPDACQKPAGLNDFSLNILPQSLAKRWALCASMLGFAILSSDGEGRAGGVSYDAVEALGEWEASRVQLLGAVMAHEVGHLLLRSKDHSPAGLMRARWDSKDLERAAKGDLLFVPQQAALIRAHRSR